VWDVSAESGLFRLSGHRGQITDLAFLGGAGQGRLASGSKDELVKVWDLDTQHCCQTIACRGGEVWALDVDFSQKRLAVGTADSELRVYAVHAEADEDILQEMGSLKSTATERAGTVRYARGSDGSALLMRQGVGKVSEVWRVRSDAEAQKRLRRRRKRRKEKGRTGKKGADDGIADKEEEGNEEAEEQLSAVDELELMATIRSKHKVSAAAMAPPTGRRAPSRLVLALANNSLEVYEIKESNTEKTDGTAATNISKLLAIDNHGHRSDIRAVTLSSDDSMVLSTSNSGVKIWNPRSGACIRTIDSGYGLCALFVPGNKHAVVGTKEGTLEILDIAASTRIESVQAHSGPVWSIAALPDGSGFVSGSADKEVKFWEWDLVVPSDSDSDQEEEEKEEEKEIQGSKKNKNKKKDSQGNGKPASKQKSDRRAPRPPQLSIAQSRTLTMTDDVLCVRLSPDGKLLAVALLDSTVRVFFTESLKFSLSLYGHKLPVLSMDISSDGTLLATGSADKNLKIWGLDFGDCHRSLFAHNDSVMAVAFVPKTHYLFTAGKDAVVKYWDGDKFEELLQLKGHQGEVWAMAVSSLGDFVITGSHDRGLRRWERTEEPFFVEEEKEKRLESLFEEDLGREDARPLVLGPDGGAVAEDGTGVVPAGKKTLETVSAADAIVEALDMASTEEERIEEAMEEAQRKNQKKGGGAAGGGSIEDGAHDFNSGALADVAPTPLMLGLSPSEYVLRSVSQVRGSELEQAILLLPFTDALRLLGYLAPWLRRGAQVELLCRVATLLLRVHMQQLMATPSARPVLTELQGLLRSRVQGLKDAMGFNLAAIEHLRRVVADQGGGGNVQGAATAVLPLKRKLEASK